MAHPATPKGNMLAKSFPKKIQSACVYGDIIIIAQRYCNDCNHQASTTHPENKEVRWLRISKDERRGLKMWPHWQAFPPPQLLKPCTTGLV